MTVYTDYALRVLMDLATKPEPKPTIADIARAHGISRNHLMKVVYELGKGGFIATVSGHRGGLGLRRPAAEIRLGDVVRQTEPDLNLVPCFAQSGGDCCVVSPACNLRSALDRARAAFMDVLDQYSLEDLVENRDTLLGLLDGAPRSATAQGG